MEPLRNVCDSNQFVQSIFFICSNQSFFNIYWFFLIICVRTTNLRTSFCFCHYLYCQPLSPCSCCNVCVVGFQFFFNGRAVVKFSRFFVFIWLIMLNGTILSLHTAWIRLDDDNAWRLKDHWTRQEVPLLLYSSFIHEQLQVFLPNCLFFTL